MGRGGHVAVDSGLEIPRSLYFIFKWTFQQTFVVECNTYLEWETEEYIGSVSVALLQFSSMTSLTA